MTDIVSLWNSAIATTVRSDWANGAEPVQTRLIGPVRATCTSSWRRAASAATALERARAGGDPRRAAASPATACPSTRALAADLGLARGTVAEAYAQLTAEGYLTRAPGRADARGRSAVAGRRRRRRRSTTARRRRASTSSRARRTSAAFPRAAVAARAAARASRLRPTACSATATCAAARSCGRRSPPTSAARAAWSPTRTGSSSARASTRASRCCSAALPGRTLAMEDPCLHFHRAIARAAGREIVPLAVDEHGARADRAPRRVPARRAPHPRAPVPARRDARPRAAGGVRRAGRASGGPS